MENTGKNIKIYIKYTKVLLFCKLNIKTFMF